MRIMKMYRICLLIGSMIFGIFNANAQKDSVQLKQEVEVTKAYQPTISEVEKINDIPKIKTEPSEAPTFDYSIFSKPVFSTFSPEPVAAAKMVGEPKSEMGKGILKLGFGNYLTPYGELFFNAQPDKNSNFGMHFRHFSSSGKIKLLNDDKIKAPESQNSAKIFGEKFFRRSTLSGSLAFDRKAFTYYGYTGDLLTEKQKEEMIPFFQKRQYFSIGTADVHLKSGKLSASDFNYDFGIDYHYLQTKTGQAENQVVLSGDMNQKFGKTTGLLSSSVTYYKADSILNNFSAIFGSKQQILLKINPSAMWKTKQASLQLGLNSTMVFDDDADASFLIWPKLKAEWSPVLQILTLFAGVDGYLQHNTYSTIAAENPYVNPYHDVLNTNLKFIFSGGLKGRLSSKTNYITEASYSMVNDQYFYMLYGRDVMNLSAVGPRSLNNTFDWVYDDVNILNISAEVMHSVSDNFSLNLSGDYYSYDLKSLSKAWQLPNFNLTLSGIYKPTNQLKFTADIFVIGKRTALVSESTMFSASSFAPPSLKVAMDPIIDLNASVEYQFSDKLTSFIRLNNFGFQKYEQWLGYTNKGFNLLAGISYSF